MIFDRGQIPLIRAGRITAIPIPISQPVTQGRVRPIRRRHTIHDQDDNPTGEKITTLELQLTVLSTRRTNLHELTLADARACGYRTVTDLQQAWQAQHPRAQNIQIVNFAFGDTRDRPLFLSHTRHIRAGIQGDYTHSRSRACDAGEVLTPVEYARYAATATQHHAARSAKTAAARESVPLAERVARLEELPPHVRKRIGFLPVIIEQRLDRQQRKAS